MNLLNFTNDFLMLSIAMVAIFLTMKSMEKYPLPPNGTRFIGGGFFLLFLNRIIFLGLHPENGIFLALFMTLHFIGSGLLVTGGVQFKLKHYRPLPLLIGIASVGAILSYFFIFVSSNVSTVYLVYNYSFSLALIVLGICFLLKPKMEKTGGFLVTSIALFMMAIMFILQFYASGEMLLSITPFSVVTIATLVVGLVMVNANIMWSQLEFLLVDVKKSKSLLKIVIQASPFPIVISKLRDNSIILINDKAADTFGIDTLAPENYKTSDFFADNNSRKELQQLLEESPELENFEIALKKTNSTETFWMLMSCRVIDFENDIALYSAFQDIGEIKEKEQQLFSQATRDPLTNSYNRRQFEELATKELYKTSRSKEPFSLIMIDADHFKKVNDTYGHATGDIVLKELVNCCKETLRESDIIARYGGEEFVIILPDTPINIAHTVSDRLRKNIANLDVIGVNNENIKFTVSMGLAESTTGDTIEKIIEVADAALYVAKESGRNRVVIGDKEMLQTNSAGATEILPAPQKLAGLVIEDKQENNIETESDMPLDEEKFALPKSIWDDDSDTDNSLDNALEDENMAEDVIPSANHIFTDDTAEEDDIPLSPESNFVVHSNLDYEEDSEDSKLDSTEDVTISSITDNIIEAGSIQNQDIDDVEEDFVDKENISPIGEDASTEDFAKNEVQEENIPEEIESSEHIIPTFIKTPVKDDIHLIDSSIDLQKLDDSENITNKVDDKLD